MERLPTTRRTLTRLAGATCSLTAAFAIAAVAPADASVDIEKTTNGQDADTGAGPTVIEGDTVNWTWRVTASAELYDIVVTDTSGAVPDCDTDGDGLGDGTFIHPGPLEPGHSFVCTATQRASNVGQTYVAYGKVRAYDFGGSLFEDRDASHHTVALPATSTTEATSAATEGPDPTDSSGSETDAPLNDATSNLSPTEAFDDDAEGDIDRTSPTGTDVDETDANATGQVDGRTGDRSTGATTDPDIDGTAADEEPSDLAMTSEQAAPARTNWPIGLGLTTIGIGLLFIGYRLDRLLGVRVEPISSDEAGLGDPNILG